VNEKVDVQSLCELLDESVARFAARPLFLRRIDGGWVPTTYGEFKALVNDCSAALAELGVSRGDRVGVISKNSLEWAVIAYASYARGATLVPMYESQPESDWEYIVRDSAIKVLFASTPSIFTKVAPLETRAPRLERVFCIDTDFDDILARGRGRTVPDAAPLGGDTAALLYTSGTTGHPKGVVLTHANVLSNVRAVRDIIASTIANPEQHLTLSFLPWAHAFGHTVELHALIACGASMAIAESLDTIVDNIREVKPTVLVAVPTVFLRIHAGLHHQLSQKAPWIRWLARRGLELSRQLSDQCQLSTRERLLLLLANTLVFARIRARFGGRLRFAICGAAALPREAAELMDALGITIYEGYGLTEASPIVAANAPGARKLGSVGRPLPGVRIEIERRPDAQGESGEIIVYGDNVMQGYHGLDAENQRTLTTGHGLRTGDLGYLDSEGYLFITGRIKEQYKLTNAKYVAPSPLEDRLKLSPWIENALIYGDNRAYNVALLVPNSEAVRSFAGSLGLEGQPLPELLEHPRVKQRFAEELARFSTEFRNYEKVREFALLSEPFSQEQGTLTPSMKLKRGEIAKRFRAELEALYAEPDDVRAPVKERFGFIS
jgi:long-chain acyl-CoA synthetase